MKRRTQCIRGSTSTQTTNIPTAQRNHSASTTTSQAALNNTTAGTAINTATTALGLV